MLTESDKRWLAENYPNLSIESDNRVAGNLSFTATYSAGTGRFLQIIPDVVDGVGGMRLSGTFHIAIATRITTPHSRLPALTVEGLDTIPDRHFNQSDLSACMCNPIEEDEYLEPSFSFQRYFEELVIPFLYGQLYYSQEGRWPWFDYAHGGLGTIEAFSKNATYAKAKECIQRISTEKLLWKNVKVLLLQVEDIKGHTSCPCRKRDHLRRCHPVVFRGLILLREMVKVHGIELPKSDTEM
jgi:hypothetical protein